MSKRLRTESDVTMAAALKKLEGWCKISQSARLASLAPSAMVNDGGFFLLAENTMQTLLFVGGIYVVENQIISPVSHPQYRGVI